MKKTKRVFIAGNVTAKPLLQKCERGRSFARLTLIINRISYREGHWKRTPYLHSVLVWGKTAEICEKYLDKGFPLAIEGCLEISENSTRIVADEVHFLGLRTMAEQYGVSEGAPVAPKNSKED